jgi:hypothetical protein
MHDSLVLLLGRSPAPTPAAASEYERARLAAECLSGAASDAALHWREAQRAAAAAAAAASVDPDPRVHAWRESQLAEWAGMPPGAADMQQRLWAARGALGERCRHAVDEPAEAACPLCQSAMDPDPGACMSACMCAFAFERQRAPACLRLRAVGNDARSCASSRLVGPRSSEAVAVYHRACTARDCGYSEPFDGLACGVANWSNQTLFCEELLRDYWNGFFQQMSMTINSYWVRTRQAFEFSGQSERDFVSRSLFTTVVEAFVADLVDSRHDAAFTCPVCRHLEDHQKTVVLDGLVMGMRRSQRKVWVAPETEGVVEDM